MRGFSTFCLRPRSAGVLVLAGFRSDSAPIPQFFGRRNDQLEKLFLSRVRVAWGGGAFYQERFVPARRRPHSSVYFSKTTMGPLGGRTPAVLAWIWINFA